MDKRPAARALAYLRERSGLSQTELARAVGMKPSQVSKRETGTDRIRPAEYELWDRGLKLPSGAFDAEVERQRSLLAAESSRSATSKREVDTSAATAAIQVVLGELGPIVADICKNSDGAEREQMLQEIVTFAEGVASAAKASARHSGSVLLGPPDEDLHGAHRAYFEPKKGTSDADEKEGRSSVGG